MKIIIWFEDILNITITNIAFFAFSVCNVAEKSPSPEMLVSPDAVKWGCEDTGTRQQLRTSHINKNWFRNHTKMLLLLYNMYDTHVVSIVNDDFSSL